MIPSCVRTVSLHSMIFCFAYSVLTTVCVLATADVRDKAVVSLSFDDLPDTGVITTTADTAKIGKLLDAVSLTQNPSRIPSAFVAGSAGSSLLLDPSRKQQIVIANSEDVSRPDAISVSGLFANLQSADANMYYGLFAKRHPTSNNTTNYGINFNPGTDTFQVYVNDDTGYKVVQYSVKTTIGYQRRVHLTICLDHADAPGADADADVDDVRLRVFVNGLPATPTNVTGGFIEANVGWLQDVSLAKCVSDSPLTIGSSFTDGEMLRLVCDEFHVFAEALTNEEATALFNEVAGASAAEISKEQTAGAASTQTQPVIGRIIPHAIEISRTMRVQLVGMNLQGARLHTDVAGISSAVAEGGNEQQGLFDVTVAENVLPGRYLVRCVTLGGVSKPVVIAVDRIPTAADGTYTKENPAMVLPTAVAGIISGTEQKQLWFRGTANQTVVAEVEARRVGSKLDPVVEIRSLEGTPLALQWQQAELQGDARATVTLPTDGLYVAEVHDLQFRAVGGSLFRLMVGDLPPSSIAFPATLTSAETSLRTLSKNSISEAVSIRENEGGIAVQSGAPILPLPALRTLNGIHVTEPMEGTFPEAAVDAAFTATPFLPLFISGRIAAPGETDTVLLTVTPGQTLNFQLAARAISSPLRGHMVLFNGDAIVAENDGNSGVDDPTFNFAVPEGVTQLKVRVRDINEKGSQASAYQLQIARPDRPAFAMSTREESIQLPQNGSTPVRLSVVRTSPSFRYTGPIHLSTSGMSSITIVPRTIAASEQNQDVLVMLTRNAAGNPDVAANGQSLTISGTADGPAPMFSTTVSLDFDSIPMKALTLADEEIVTGLSEPTPGTILLETAPPILLRGLSAVVPVRVLSLTDQAPPFVRFEMTTTEPVRREDPKKSDSPVKPRISLNELQFGQVSQGVFELTVRVPTDTPSSSIDAVISADFVAQPLASGTGSSAWTAPTTLFIEDAVTVAPPADAKGTKAGSAVITGTVQRHPSYDGEFTVVLDGLPKDYAATPATVVAGQSAFTMNVTIPESATPGEVPNLTVRAQVAGGSTISKPVAVKIVVE